MFKLLMLMLMMFHRDRSKHIERECLDVFTFAKFGCFVRPICLFYYFFTTQILGAVAADLLYKSVPGLCLIFSRAARYPPKPALNNIISLCVYYDLYVMYTQKLNLNAFEFASAQSPFLKKWANPGLYFIYFHLFKHTLQFLQQINVKKCPYSIWYRDSNP